MSEYKKIKPIDKFKFEKRISIFELQFEVHESILILINGQKTLSGQYVPFTLQYIHFVVYLFYLRKNRHSIPVLNGASHIGMTVHSVSSIFNWANSGPLINAYSSSLHSMTLLMSLLPPILPICKLKRKTFSIVAKTFTTFTHLLTTIHVSPSWSYFRNIESVLAA